MNLEVTHAAKATSAVQKALPVSSALIVEADSTTPGKYIRPRLLLPPSAVRILITAETKLGSAVAAPAPAPAPLGTVTVSTPSDGDTFFQTNFSSVHADVTTGNRCVMKHSASASTNRVSTSSIAVAAIKWRMLLVSWPSM